MPTFLISKSETIPMLTPKIGIEGQHLHIAYE